MHRYRRSVLFALTTLALAATGAAAQDIDRVGVTLLQEVMPGADRFDPAEGQHPARPAYRGEELIGYVFATSDLPPEESGYSGPIRALVGLTTNGVVTGVHVTGYRESRRYDWGDFLSEPSFLGQFIGKTPGDRFAVGLDIDGISGVTISVRAMAKGIRNAARRVALTHLTSTDDPGTTLSDEEVVSLSWYEMQQQGLVATMPVRQSRRNPMELWLIHMSSEEIGRRLVGGQYEPLMEKIEEAGGADEVMLYVVAGGGFVPPLRTGWSIEQGARTVEIPRERVVTGGRPLGALSGESSQFGALLLDEDDVDMTAPLTIAFDRDRPDLGVSRVEYTSRTAFVRVVEAEGPAEPEALAEASTPDDVDVASGTDVVAADAAVTPDPVDVAVTPAVIPPVAEPVQPVPNEVAEAVEVDEVVEALQDDGLEADLLPSAWSGVGWTVLVILLAGLAFFTKNEALRWVSLAATMVALGWIDGGFLSISHVTGLVWVGSSAIRSDPSLSILVGITVVSVVLWGRVFCGYLCPFGALQDFIDRFVPRRFKRELPEGAHRVAWKAKYLVLAVILGAALVGVQTSLYQYVEPFGTVFSVGRNPLLWAIAAVILLASAVVPRFYCRYVCPLGALLAVGSVLSLRRIPRVEQCDHCHVCEQKCPTRAISGPKIAFGECVRCNICEVQLLQRRGVCQHDMEDIRPRLVQLELQNREPAATHRSP